MKHKTICEECIARQYSFLPDPYAAVRQVMNGGLVSWNPETGILLHLSTDIRMCEDCQFELEHLAVHSQGEKPAGNNDEA
jgi:hypothetical protein